ncbi:CAP domain-containing protein [Roseibium sp.]|uniref:CAP domain-containing protein n=1 Tax=Roseibium sp. TaxID=1936156 RepID=UPI003D0FC8B8
MLRFSLIFAALLALSACSTPEPRFGPDGKPLPQVYRISSGDTAEIQFRMLDGVNALREARGAAPVSLNSELTAAAKTHSRDMSVQNRPWHFGSDGSSPLDRAAQAGYRGRLIGENISETFETELQTLSAWMEQPETRQVILDPRARDLGFAWYQESNGKIWWTMVVGQPGAFRGTGS